MCGNSMYNSPYCVQLKPVGTTKYVIKTCAAPHLISTPRRIIDDAQKTHSSTDFRIKISPLKYEAVINVYH